MTRFLSNESKVLLDLLANSLFDANIEIDLKSVDLGKLFSESKSQTVLALAFDSLPTIAREYNPAVYDNWQMYSFSIMHRNANQMHSNAELEGLFTKAGLPICTIKGFASCYYYTKKHLRQMGDIDFIVPTQRFEECKKLLSDNGFKCVDNDEDHDFHIGYTKNKDLYEMHKGITSLLDENGYIEKYIKDIFDNTYFADFGEAKITIPDTFAHGLIMLLHMQRHMLTGGGVGLRHLCDWATFVNAVDNSEWKEVFEKKLKNINLWEFARVLSKVSSIYLKIEEKEWFSEIDNEIAEKLLADMIIAGNFGHKDVKRYREILFLSKTHKRENKISRYFKGLIEKVYAWKIFYKKHKYLLPFGIIAYIFRTAFLILSKKKKINLADTHKSGTERNDLYNKIFK